jgi:hypothetical protein
MKNIKISLTGNGFAIISSAKAVGNVSFED